MLLNVNWYIYCDTHLKEKPFFPSLSSKLDLDTKPVLTCATTRSLENIRQHAGEEVMLKGQDKDGDVMETEARDETQEEAKAPAESRSQAGNSGDIQEVTIEEEQLAGGSSTDVKADNISVPQEEDEDEDEMGNRLVIVYKKWISAIVSVATWEVARGVGVRLPVVLPQSRHRAVQ